MTFLHCRGQLVCARQSPTVFLLESTNGRVMSKSAKATAAKKLRVVDPITVEVIRYSLISAVWEMFRVFRRTTTLALLYEMNDFAIAIHDADLNLLAEAPGMPMFSGSLDFAIAGTLPELREDKIEPYDVIVNNHPFLVGGQPADAALFEAIFYRDELVAYVGMRAHMGDCGAINQYPVSSTDMYQEGTIFPAVKLFRRGVLDKSVLRTIEANSRLPLETGGNYLAGAACLAAGRKRLLEIVEKYGMETVKAAKEQIYDHAERLTRQAIERIPDGTYTVTDAMDGNGVENDPVPIKLAVTIKNSNATVDMTGSAPQQKGPINCAYSYTATAARFGLKLLTVGSLPTSAGVFRPLTVIAPEGSLYNPLPPAPGWLGGWASARIIDLMQLALAEVLPDKIPAPASCAHNVLLGYIKDPANPKKTHFVLDISPQGLGGTAEQDGASGVGHVKQAGSVNIPVEVHEAKSPVLIERYELSTTSGPGKHRGGYGVRTVMKFLAGGQLTTVMERTKYRLPGIRGGKPSPVACKLILWPGTPKEVLVGKSDHTMVVAGDRAIIDTTGGSGYGDPLDRDPALVAEDVLNEYISSSVAKESYGVVLDLASGKVDAEATDQLRQQMGERPKANANKQEDYSAARA